MLKPALRKFCNLTSLSCRNLITGSNYYKYRDTNAKIHSKSTKSKLLQEYSQTPLKAEFVKILAFLKCFIKDELNNIRETVEKVSEKFDQIFYREYTKNLWDEIASKNTIICLLTENINNLSRSHSQSEICYQPQKHNETQNNQILLYDQPFTVPRKVAKEKELRKPSYENVISPNRLSY